MAIEEREKAVRRPKLRNRLVLATTILLPVVVIIGLLAAALWVIRWLLNAL
jgi:hypothetical protein